MNDQTFAPVVYVLSDSAGDTGDSVVRAAAAQFYPVQVDIRRSSFIVDRSDVDKAIVDVVRDRAIILFTLVVPQLRDYVIELAVKHGIPYIDTLGPVISSLEKVIGQESRHKPGMIHELNEDYFRKVEAVEFAVKYDDGRDPMGVLKADIVLVGVSRTSKTPLSMYLAYKKFKVANVPLVPELKPPNELFTVSKRKIIGLTINPDKLNQIRKERLKALGLAGDANYANVNRIVSELEYSQRIIEKLGCHVIDVSTRAVEETASLIIDFMR
ncbi:pyruvate, water dikinase regulatory protein [Paenibacillus gansuensis]|uniref:Putative pyruvate, phosphate dikinase regulatory protein n=1 Tax=Paenibacillus gansuensis TaxID=306542 RepID=A0ABW5PC47_9BACL